MSDVAAGTEAARRGDLRGVLPAGTVLRGYELKSILGQGAFGITYRGRDATLNRDVAIKEYLPTSLALREGRTTVMPRLRPLHSRWEARSIISGPQHSGVVTLKLGARTAPLPPAPSAYDGIYTGAFSSVGGTGVTAISVKIAGGRASGTITTPGCPPHRGIV